MFINLPIARVINLSIHIYLTWSIGCAINLKHMCLPWTKFVTFLVVEVLAAAVIRSSSDSLFLINDLIYSSTYKLNIRFSRVQLKTFLTSSLSYIMSELLDASIIFCLISMHLMTYWYLDFSKSWPIEVSLLQIFVAFCLSKCASKYWKSWVSDRFGVLSSTFLRVKTWNRGFNNTAYNFWFLIPCFICLFSIWCMRLLCQLILPIYLTNLTFNFKLFPQ